MDQAIIVTIIIGIALVYAGYMIFKKMRGFTKDGSCEAGCGKCGSKSKA
jgi:hypothetical protein